MNNKKKPRFLCYVLESLAAYSLFFGGLYYLARYIIGATLETSLFIVVPIVVVLTPCIILGLHMAYKRYYSNSTSVSNIIAGNNANIIKWIFIIGLFGSVAGVTAQYAFIYIYRESRYLIGGGLGIISIVMSLLHLPYTKKMLEMLFPSPSGTRTQNEIDRDRLRS